MEKITDKKAVNRIVILLVIAYVVSYLTRINYGAVISEMQTSTGISKSLLSMAVTGSFVTYGLGQIISGVLGDRISPKRIVMIGFVITSAMNLLIPLCSSPYLMLAVWSVNGFAQSLIWPPIVKIMSSKLTDLDYSKNITKVSYGGCIGTVIVYLISPVIITFAGWKAVFVTSGIIGIIMIIFWQKLAVDVEIKKVDKNIPKTEKGDSWLTPLVFAIMIAIVLQGALRDGTTTWMPSYISETYNLGNAISILTGVLLPLFGLLCCMVAGKIHIAKIKNPVNCAALFFGIGTVFALFLNIFTGKNAVMSTASIAILNACMHGVNTMLICMIPNYFKSTGKVSTVSGVLNSCTYVGSAVSTYGIAYLSDMFGWDFTVMIWFVIAVIGTAIALVCGKFWSKRKFA